MHDYTAIYCFHSAMCYIRLSRKLMQPSFIYFDSCIDYYKREIYDSMCLYLHT